MHRISLKRSPNITAGEMMLIYYYGVYKTGSKGEEKEKKKTGADKYTITKQFGTNMKFQVGKMHTKKIIKKSTINKF